jgi:hypothetical protein
MKPRKKTILVMLFGLLLLAFVAVVAQTPSQSDQKKADACCAVDSCCKGDSCKMKKKEMNHVDDRDCCGCCSDSCDMKMKTDATMKHDMKGHKADCCKAKAKDAKDNNKN